jgi:hypothetical protein
VYPPNLNKVLERRLCRFAALASIPPFLCFTVQWLLSVKPMRLASLTLAPVLFTLLNCSGTSTQDLLDGDFITKDARPITLISPADKQLILSSSLPFLWTPVNGVGQYRFQVARDAAFSDIKIDRIVDKNYINLTSTDGLNQLNSANYYWRVSVPYLKKNLQSEALAFGVLPQDSNGGFTMYVNGSSIVTPLQGTQSNPYTSVSAAVAAGHALRGADTSKHVSLFVAQGTYSESIALPGGIAIYGGYSASNWTRSITGNPTTLQPKTGSSIIITVLSDATVALRDSTVVDGFYFGATNLASGTNGLITTVSGSVTVSNNYFNTFSSTLFQRCLYFSGGSPVITGNTFNKSVAQDGRAAEFVSNANATFSNNTIIMSGSVDRILGFNNSSGVVQNNTFNSTATADSIGLYLESSSALRIDRNTITVSTSAGALRPIYFDLASNATATNNIITSTLTGGTDTNSAGITMYGSSPVVANNVIIQRITGGSGTYHVLYAQGGNRSPKFVNNIVIAADSGGARNCVSDKLFTAGAPDVVAAEIRNNIFINCSEAITTGSVPSVTASSGNTAYTWAQFSTLAFQGGAAYSLGMDFHLTTSTPTTVRFGGIDATTAGYGSVTIDKDNLSRTCPTAVTNCLSIGPYELD